MPGENFPGDRIVSLVDELEGLPCPGALGVAKTLDEHHGVIRSVRIIAGGFIHKSCGLVFLQFSHCVHPQGIKIAATTDGATS